jgi:hypothetical protein
MVDALLDRRELLPGLFPNPSEYLMVSGLAGASRDAAALTSEADNIFTMGGAMGAAVSIGLGMALCAPDRQIAVITGDGELMMNIGSLATVATAAANNLSIVCIDNGRHGETGGQKSHTAERTDLELMAKGAGIPATLTISIPVGQGHAWTAIRLETQLAPGGLPHTIPGRGSQGLGQLIPRLADKDSCDGAWRLKPPGLLQELLGLPWPFT